MTDPGSTSVHPPAGRSLRDLLNWGTARRSPESRLYLLPGLGLLLITLAVLAYGYSVAPIPPGVDPGHWLATSFSYVGLPHPGDPTDAPFFYPPLTFPLLGLSVLLAGSPTEGAFLFAGALLFLYGLSVIHLARRFLLFGPLQVLLVGLALFCGTTLQMLFWGGYPNFLAFVFFNEAIVFLLAFVRSRSTLDGLLFYAMVALTYLTHDLTFAVLGATIVVVAVLLFLLRKVTPRILLSRGNLLGLALLAAVVFLYFIVTQSVVVGHANYLTGNPATYSVENIGLYFVPLGAAPAFFPPGGAFSMPPQQGLEVLLGAAAVLFASLLALWWRYPRQIDTRAVIGAGWLISVLLVPAAGYLAHVDTDYTRFVYFLPLPVALASTLAAERLFAGQIFRAAPGGSPGAPPPAASPTVRSRGRISPTTDSVLLGSFCVFVTLVLVLAYVSVPTVENAEESGSGHDANALDALQWLASSKTPGAVLTTQIIDRWVEGISARTAFTPGPTWLLFNSFQINNAEEALWALTTNQSVTNGEEVYSVSGFNTSGVPTQNYSTFSSAILGPLYSAYFYGAAFPFFEFNPASSSITVSGQAYPLYWTGEPLWPTVATNATGNGSVEIGYPVQSVNGTVEAYVNVTATLGSGGASAMQFDVGPNTITDVTDLSLVFTGPPATAPPLHPGAPTGCTGKKQPASFWWNESGPIGGEPGKHAVSTEASFDPQPSSLTDSACLTPTAVFYSPNGSIPRQVSLELSTPGVSNPTATLPVVMSTGAFLDQNNICFLLWPNSSASSYVPQLYLWTLGFRIVYSNPEWLVLQSATVRS